MLKRRPIRFTDIIEFYYRLSFCLFFYLFYFIFFLAQLVRKCKISALEECKNRYAQAIDENNRYKVTWLGWIQKVIEKKTELPFDIDYSTWINYKNGCFTNLI